MSPAGRNTCVDAIRVFALIGICVVNLPFHALPADQVMAMPAATSDRLVAFVVATLFEAKFFLLFSFLFGWTLSEQDRSATRAGISPLVRHLRRIAGLALIGFAHAFLVFTGDILILYALLGFAIWPLRGLPPRHLVHIAMAMIPVSFAALFALALTLDDVPLAAGQAGGFVSSVSARIADWPGTFAFLLLFQGPLAFGAFALGIAAARTGFFDAASAGRALLARRTPVFVAVGLPLNLLFALATLSAAEPGLLALFGLLAIAVGAPLLAGAYLHGFILLSERFPLPPLLFLAGRNSLSAYVLQGVVAGLIFGGYGFGLFGKLGFAALSSVALLVALASLVLVGVFAGVAGRGPLEIVLRRITIGAGR